MQSHVSQRLTAHTSKHLVSYRHFYCVSTEDLEIKAKFVTCDEFCGELPLPWCQCQEITKCSKCVADSGHCMKSQGSQFTSSNICYRAEGKHPRTHALRAFRVPCSRKYLKEAHLSGRGVKMGETKPSRSFVITLRKPVTE